MKLEIVHKDTIKIRELTIHSIQSFLAEAKQSLPEVEALACLSIEEICAGKLSALIWRYLLGEDKDREPQHIRHLYDIALLAPTLCGMSQFKNIAVEIIEEDLEERRKSQPTSVSGIKKKIWKELESNVTHKANYQMYVENYIYGSSGKQLTFEEAVKRLKTLVEPLGNLPNEKPTDARVKKGRSEVPKNY